MFWTAVPLFASIHAPWLVIFCSSCSSRFLFFLFFFILFACGCSFCALSSGSCWFFFVSGHATPTHFPPLVFTPLFCYLFLLPQPQPQPLSLSHTVGFSLCCMFICLCFCVYCMCFSTRSVSDARDFHNRGVPAPLHQWPARGEPQSVPKGHLARRAARRRH